MINVTDTVKSESTAKIGQEVKQQLDYSNKLSSTLYNDPKNTGSCPHCGYCPHCGRSGRSGNYYYPYHPYYPYSPRFEWCTESPYCGSVTDGNTSNGLGTWNKKAWEVSF